MYLREIGQVDLLTADDERRLAKRIEAGQPGGGELDRRRSRRRRAERRRLLRIVQRGERAKSELTQANLRLVVASPSATSAAACCSSTSSRRATSA